MTSAVDKRDWLVSKGLAKPGRGRFSADAKTAIAEAEKNGIVFADKSVTLSTVVFIDDNGERQEEKREVNPFAHHPEPIRTNDYYTFTGAKGFRLQVSVTEACNTCRYSLGWCYCETPTFRHWRTGEVLNGRNV